MLQLMKTALIAVCGCTMLAAVYLTASLAVLQPPNANYGVWAVSVIVIAVAGGVTLAALVLRPWPAIELTAAGGGVAAALLGASSIYRTLSGPHFEGYALVLGAALVAQGALTLVWLALHRATTA